MGQAKVVTLHPLDDADALAWLIDELGSCVETSVNDLAQQFGWPRTRLRRRLAEWVKAGQITKLATRKGKFTITPAPELVVQDRALDSQSALRIVGRAFSPQLITISASPDLTSSRLVSNEPAAQAPSRPRSAAATGAACLLLATAVSLTLVGLIMNARFAASFGQTIEAAVILAAIGLAIDVLAVVMPTVAAQLWQIGARPAAAMAWMIWSAALFMTLLAAVGFASTNIGDAVAGRAKIATENASLGERIEHLRRERFSITEDRAVEAIEVELQRVQPAAQAVWKLTDGCRDVTRTSSARTCAPVLQLREAQAMAQRRNALDAELRDAEARRAALPPIATADPQTTTAAEIVTWLSSGHLRPEPRDIAWLRTVGLVMTPSLAGLVAMLALSLLRVRRA